MRAEGKRVAIVGGGLAGLSCALRLEELGALPFAYESSDELGGRVRTDVVDGFLLGPGFQVYLRAYPEAGRLPDLDALDLCRFKPGALVYRNGRLNRVVDVFRSPRHLLSSAPAPAGPFGDKLLVSKLRRQMLRKTLEEIALRGGDVVCGDHRHSASVEGAILSGRRAAEAVV